MGTLDEVISHSSAEVENQEQAEKEKQDYDEHHLPMIKTSFPKSDANGDGKLNREEWATFTETFENPADDEPAEGDAMDFFAEIDADKDGFVTFDELVSDKDFEERYLEEVKVNFPKSDADSDGKLSKEEWA